MFTLHAAAPTQLPKHMTAVKMPYSRHTSRLPSLSSLHQRANIQPLETAHMQKQVICEMQVRREHI